MIEEEVVLVDEYNTVLGTMPKLKAHQEGVLHRAVSILIYNSTGDMLIQQRARTKYHWPMIWSNAVCSHPRVGEDFLSCAQRRLREELNIITSLSEIYRFIYKAKDSQTGLIEHEFDVVFKGKYNGTIPYNPDEINAVRWISPEGLKKEIDLNPENFSFWFREILKKINE